MKQCESCKTSFEPLNSTGRPRKYCYGCAPPGDKGAAGSLWRKRNPEKVAAYNEGRRLVPHNPWRDPEYRRWVREQTRALAERPRGPR